MANIITALLCLYCKNGCSASVVQSALTFHPPYPPFYAFVYDDENDSFSFEMGEDITPLPDSMLKGVSAFYLTTKTNTLVPVLLFRVADATRTIIFSHGNATDLGASFATYALMAAALGVNIGKN